MWYRTLTLLLFLALWSPVAAQEDGGETTTLTLLTHDSFDLPPALLAEFAEETGIELRILRAGDTGTLITQAILSANDPLGDLLFGVDNTFLSRALAADLFLPYVSDRLAEIDPRFWLEDEERVTPIDYGDVCLNYDRAYFAEHQLAIPETLLDLTKAEYAGLLVVQNPATSSPGLAFLLATVAVFGVESEYNYLDFWQDLAENDVRITEGWTAAYFGEFTAGSETGTRPLVVSYASSPPFTVDEETGEAATGSIVAPDTCFRQVEYVGILRGTENEVQAQRFVDFMLSRSFQEALPDSMYVFPVHPRAALPAAFSEHAQIPAEPVVISAAEIAAGRQEWTQAWLELMLR
ncbi:MAG: thiamine ABC transporter substrate-binding protein [Anaerolineaceae bacterium]|nr:thiamine ABC transporter substrate-binding protein [Anaerolineaceae bacterium]